MASVRNAEEEFVRRLHAFPLGRAEHLRAKSPMIPEFPDACPRKALSHPSSITWFYVAGAFAKDSHAARAVSEA